jgi:glycosyltransferase involved in cell wall biosynthesis
MLAYNHERFVAKAVESVLAQKTTFPIELVIGEDCSTDATRTILQQFAQNEPSRIRLLMRERNLGPNGNYVATLAECRGEYLALLEGDDYWTEPTKLQQQVSYLDSHLNCALTFHDVRVVSDEGSVIRDRACDPNLPERSTGEDLLARNYIPSCSVLYRRTAMPEPPPAHFAELPMQDWPTWLHVARSGDIAYMNNVWASYRVHSGGVWSTQTFERQWRNALRFYRAVRPEIPHRWMDAANSGEKFALVSLIDLLVAERRWRDAGPLARRFLLLPPRRFVPPAGRRGLFYRLALGVPSRLMREIENLEA